MKRADTAPPNGWEKHAAEQRRAWLRLTDAERLAWLDQAKEFAAEALASARRRRARPKSEGMDLESPQPKDTGGAARR